MKKAGLLAALGFALCVALGAGPAAAQDDPMPITVTATPRLVLPGAPVKFAGTTVADGKRFEVVLTVRFPASGERIERRVRVDSAGAYSFTLTTLHTSGDYTVSALAPDGRGKDSTTFSVSDVEDVMNDIMDAMHDILEDGKAIETRVGEEIRSLPESPAKRELVDKLEVLEDSVRVEPERVQRFREVLSRLGAVRSKYPESERVFRDMYVHLGDEIFRTQAEADARKFEILKQLDQSRAAGKLCDRLETASEALKAMGAVFNLVGDLMSITRGFLTDYVAGKLGPMISQPPLRDNQGFQFGLSEAVKFGMGAILQPTGWVGFVVGFATDFATAALDKEFTKYCERFEGPFTATMHGEVFRGSETWWTMDIRIEGRLTLRYPKSDAGAAIHMTGQFEGAATDYKVWDDALQVLYPKLMRGTRTFKRTITPVGIPYTDLEGRYAALASPTAFYIPVEGDLVGRRLTLRVQPAKKDIPQAYNTARAIVAILSPLALIPVVVTYPLPYQNAEFVLKHGMEVDEGQPLVLDITVGRNSMQVQRQWQRTKPGEGVKAIYTATLRLCNPSCQ